MAEAPQGSIPAAVESTTEEKDIVSVDDDEQVDLPPAVGSAGFEVLYQNEELLVVNKPPNVAMDGEIDGLTVEKWVNESEGMKAFMARDLPKGNVGKWNGGLTDNATKKRLRFIHQLDHPTSGILCLGFSKEMAARMAHCFQQRYAQKEYVAVLHGWLPESLMTPQEDAVAGENAETKRYIRCVNVGELEMTFPIGYDETDPKELRMACVEPPKGKEAKTVLSVLRRAHVRRNDGVLVKVTHVLLKPTTGRRHQLRVQCACIGHPMIGDLLYSADGQLYDRMMLHAMTLSLGIDVDICASSYKDRVNDKRRRRRVTIGVADHAAEATSRFTTADPFVQYLVDDAA